MSNTAPQVVRTYLKQLDAALDGVPDSVRSEILGGVREELTGLDASTAAERIESLGDPLFIAAEARAAAADGTPAAEGHDAAVEGEQGWFPVIAALLLALGGIVIPVIGWIAGLAMVWFSRSWRTGEKLVATLAAPAAALVIVVTVLVAQAVAPASAGAEGSNPLVPALHDMIWSGVLLLGLVNAIAGLWLLWRIRGRRPAPGSTTAAAVSGYTVATGLIVAFGGVVVPVVGWIAGVTMMWLSRTWWAWEKVVVTLVPAATFVGGNMIALLFALANGDPVGSSVEVFGVPVLFGGVLWWNLAIAVYALTATSGFWLLFRSRRSPRPAP